MRELATDKVTVTISKITVFFPHIIRSVDFTYSKLLRQYKRSVDTFLQLSVKSRLLRKAAIRKVLVLTST